MDQGKVYDTVQDGAFTCEPLDINQFNRVGFVYGRFLSIMKTKI